MKRNRSYLLVSLMGVMLLMITGIVGHAQSVNAIKFISTVATIDLDQRELTFTDVSHVVIVPDDCEIFRMELGVAIPVKLSDIQAGDVLRVCGILQADGTVIAYKIRIRTCF